MNAKVLNIIVPFIVGIICFVIGYGIGSERTSKRFLKKQTEKEQKRIEHEYAKADSIYLVTHPVWKKKELKSQAYSAMFDSIQSANMTELKKHNSLNNPYWQETSIIFNKLSPYCINKVQTVLKTNSAQDEVHLYQLYKDMKQVRSEIIREITGIDAQPDTTADRRLSKLEERDLIYLQNNNIWNNDSIWSEKYINFMIGMFSGNIKVFTHWEINNELWQEILRYKINSKKIYDIKDIIIKASNQPKVDVEILHAMITEKNVISPKIGDNVLKEEKHNRKKEKIPYRSENF